jgi:phenylacetate-CoA ligase
MAEMLCLASDCPLHSGLHIYEDFGILEIVDRDNNPVGPGVWGEKILVTNLYNFTEPVIRYEIHDNVAWTGTPCPCGRTLPLIKGVKGRIENIVEFKTRRGGIVKLWSQHFIELNRRLKPLREFKILKRKDDVLVLFTASNGEGSFLRDFKAEFEKLLADYDVFFTGVDYRLVGSVPRSVRSGKFTQIEEVGDFPQV